MTSFGGYLWANPQTLTQPIPGTSRAAYTWRPQFSGLDVHVNDPSALSEPGKNGTYSATGGKSHFGASTYKGTQEDKATPAFDFFEKFHVLARSYSFGNIVSVQTQPLTVHNAFRRASHFWTAFTNNAGTGVSIVSMPTLPTLVPYQHSLALSLQVTPNGPPSVNSTLVFTFDTGEVVVVPITLQRVVLFPMPPEVAYKEVLEWKTDVLAHVDQTEQRIAMRDFPRQSFEWDVVLSDGVERAIVESILFAWQAETFGIPVWHEMTHSTAAAIVGATTIPVLTTANADWRVGGLGVVYLNETTFDVLQVASTTGTSVTFTSGTAFAYAAGAQVIPVRTGISDKSIQGQRYRLNGGRLAMRLHVTDNVASLASTSGQALYNGKVLLVAGNVSGEQFAEHYDREVVVIDGETGAIDQEPLSTVSQRGSSQTWFAGDPASLWAIRGLVWALRGRQVSAYLPTFMQDLQVTDPLVSGLSTINVTNVGYTQYVQSRQPRNVIRIVMTDGTYLVRTVLSSSVVSSVKETLTVDVAWASNVPTASIARIEYVEKVRLDSDQVTFQYHPGERSCKVSVPVRAVLE